jgi:hypothetical protein
VDVRLAKLGKFCLGFGLSVANPVGFVFGFLQATDSLVVIEPDVDCGFFGDFVVWQLPDSGILEHDFLFSLKIWFGRRFCKQKKDALFRHPSLCIQLSV